ncbi:MAG: diacylglycerol kinase family protein [Bacteroidales bacterium]|nr:diacylglycerol kinase family protein [Bacteroidales bacterium]
MKEALKSQMNLRFHVFTALAVILAGIIFSVSLAEWIILLMVIMAVISCELMNTAIEYTVDIVCPEFDNKAKKVKDISAAAVFVTAIFAAIIGLMILVPYFIRFIEIK